LTDATARIDELLAELRRVAAVREAEVKNLENGLKSMQEKEQALRNRIDHLKNLPLPVAEHFAELTESGEKRSAIRDYVLFGAGVVVSTIVSIILEVAL
jgi:DNA repair ATPase RecN